MNTEKTYPATVIVNGSVIARYNMVGPNRHAAVRKLLQWFWDKYKGRHGPASEVLTVSDPYSEAIFAEPFNCNDKRNNYLDSKTIERIVAESKGILERDTKAGTAHHPRRSLRRKKRHREFLTTVAPNIFESNTGTFYYRIVTVPQISNKGVIFQKRKLKSVRLEAKTLPQAIEEIKNRQLRMLSATTRRMKKRSLKLVSHLAGLITLTRDDKIYFAPVLQKKLAVTAP